ncbi:MAG: cysteine desulfurase NifS, cysteine desulfurase [Candidatus Nomurabacteria bacterium]|nr:cysteine desulfurase NifS, cysteine desulfurase [Candidatus Nomurabacteria bacterium]
MNFLANFFNKKVSRVYLDHAGSTPIFSGALNALRVSSLIYGNPSGIHKEGVQSGLLLDKARAICGRLLNAHAYEIYFVGSGTESCNLAILGTYESFIKDNPGKVPHIITTEIEHPAVLEAIRFLEKKRLVNVTYLKTYEDGIVKLNDFKEALTPETILVSVMYANNEIGTIQPIKEIGRALDEWKKENGKTFTSYPYFHTDACQAGNYLSLDVVRLRAHMITVNSSKVYGPKGIALLYKREGIKVDPIVHGGGQERGLRSGTEDASSAYAFSIALEEAVRLRETESERLRELRDYFKEKAEKEIPAIKFYGAWDIYKSRVDIPQLVESGKWKVGESLHATLYALHSELRLPNNINCRIPGITSEEMILRLDAKGFAISHKSACASSETDGSYVIISLGESEMAAKENLRITLGRTTAKKDMNDLVMAMKEIAEKYVKKIES